MQHMIVISYFKNINPTSYKIEITNNSNISLKVSLDLIYRCNKLFKINIVRFNIFRKDEDYSM